MSVQFPPKSEGLLPSFFIQPWSSSHRPFLPTFSSVQQYMKDCIRVEQQLQKMIDHSSKLNSKFALHCHWEAIMEESHLPFLDIQWLHFHNFPTFLHTKKNIGAPFHASEEGFICYSQGVTQLMHTIFQFCAWYLLFSIIHFALVWKNSVYYHWHSTGMHSSIHDLKPEKCRQIGPMIAWQRLYEKWVQ